MAQHKIKQTRRISSCLISCIKADSEMYFDVSKLTEEDIVDALSKMDTPKYSCTKSVGRLLDGSYDSSDTNNCVQIALYGEVLYDM